MEKLVISKDNFSPYYFNIFNKKSESDLALYLQAGYEVINENKMVIDELDEPDIVVHPSAKIGAMGEEFVEESLSKQFKVENVSKTGHTGDLFISEQFTEYPVGKILVEVKKYNCAIPTKEVVKFHNDLRSNMYIQGGLFISLGTKITGFSNSFDFRIIWENRQIPVIYINTEESDIIIAAATVLFQYIKLQKTKSIKLESIQNEISNLWENMINLAEFGNGLSKVRESLGELKSMFDKQIDKSTGTLWQLEMSMKRSLDNINTILLTIANLTNSETYKGGTTENNVISEIKSFSDDNDSFLKNNNVKKCVNEITKVIFNKLNYETYSSDKTDKKLVIGIGTEDIFSITKLKNKIILAIIVKNEPVQVPSCAEYKNNNVIFNIDKKFLTQAKDNMILKFIETNFN